MSEDDSVSLFNESYSYKYEDNPVISSIVQYWCSLNFQQKLLVILLFWLLVNLLMIRIAWRAYGHRLSEILTKDFLAKEASEVHVFNEEPLHMLSARTHKVHRE